MSKRLRIACAICAFLAGTWMLLFVFGILGGELSSRFTNYLFPTVSRLFPNSHTFNTNSESWGSDLLFPLAIAGGLVCGALVFDPKLTSKTEALIILSLFTLVGTVSGFNFWDHDKLINVNAQFLLDMVLSVAGLALIGLLIRSKPKSILITAVQRVSLFMVAVFGFSLPLYYAVNLLLMRFGDSEPIRGLSDLTKFLAGALGLVAAVAPTLLTPAKEPRA